MGVHLVEDFLDLGPRSFPINGHNAATLQTLLSQSEVPAAVRLKTALAILEGIGGMNSEIGPTDALVIEARRNKMIREDLL